MNPLLENIAVKASADLCDLIREGEADILTAIHKMQSEAQLQDTKPKFALGFKITWDMDKGTFDCDLSWTLKQSLSVTHQMDDPNQGTLEHIEKFVDTAKKMGGVTISSGDKSVIIALDAVDAALIQQAIEVIRSEQKASVSLLQRRMKLGYINASNLMDELERRGVVGPANGTEPREIFLPENN